MKRAIKSIARQVLWGLGLSASLAFTAAAWAAPGSMIRDDVLLASPSSGGAKVVEAKKGSPVEVMTRQGAWMQVRSGKSVGWVRILSVRTGGATVSGGDLAALTAERNNQVVAVAGLRGLNEEELRAARFNPAELTTLERYRVEQGEAMQFATAAGLTRRQLALLPEPANGGPRASSSSSGNPSQGFFGE